MTTEGLHKKRHLLVTATGADRPGIVARIAEVFVEYGANLEDSRMALLGGEFAAIILASVLEVKLDIFDQALAKLKGEGITISTKPTAVESNDKFKDHITYELQASGSDHEGIVHRVSGFLRDLKVNIQYLESDVISAPETGIPLFCMRATVQIPPSVSLAELRKNLNIIGEEELVDIELVQSAKV